MDPNALTNAPSEAPPTPSPASDVGSLPAVAAAPAPSPVMDPTALTHAASEAPPAPSQASAPGSLPASAAAPSPSLVMDPNALTNAPSEAPPTPSPASDVGSLPGGAAAPTPSPVMDPNALTYAASEAPPSPSPASDAGSLPAPRAYKASKLTSLVGVCTDCAICLEPDEVEVAGSRCPRCRDPLTLIPRIPKSRSSQSLTEESNPGTPQPVVQPKPALPNVKLEEPSISPLWRAPDLEDTQAKAPVPDLKLPAGIASQQNAQAMTSEKDSGTKAPLPDPKLPAAQIPQPESQATNGIASHQTGQGMTSEKDLGTKAPMPDPTPQPQSQAPNGTGASNLTAKGPPVVPPVTLQTPLPPVPVKAEEMATAPAVVMTDELATSLATLLTQPGQTKQGQHQNLLASLTGLLGGGATNPAATEAPTTHVPIATPARAKGPSALAVPAATEAEPAKPIAAPTPAEEPVPARALPPVPAFNGIPPAPAMPPSLAAPTPGESFPKQSMQPPPAICNSASHAREWKLLERFTEANPFATELRSAWQKGGTARLSVFSKFVQAGCGPAGNN